MLTITSCFPTRWSRYLFFLLCSPILLPLLCVLIPFLCTIEIFCRLRSRIVKSAPPSATAVYVEDDEEDDLRLRRCEEGYGGCGEFGGENGLLQRYLEDQLILVGSLYDCGQDESEDRDLDSDLFRVPLLS